MAISVDTVYKTVLLILNKEQRGYLTPDEFNKIATQVQLEIFERYFEDLNQQLRVPENSSEFGNRVKNIEEKFEPFYRDDICTGTNPFTPPTNYRIGGVFYDKYTNIEKINVTELYKIQASALTSPTHEFPVYTDQTGLIYVYPEDIVDPNLVTVSYVTKPSNVIWGYNVDPTQGYFTYDISSSTDFELHVSEQTEVILNVLMYAGIVIRDPQIIQNAAQELQQDEVNEKS